MWARVGCLCVVATVCVAVVVNCHEVKYAVRCTQDLFQVLLKNTTDIQLIRPFRVSGLILGCSSQVRHGLLEFSVDINNPFETAVCAVTLVRNRHTNQLTFYQRLDVLHAGGRKSTMTVKCQPDMSKHHLTHNLVKRSPQQQDDLWPEGFQEPQELDITSEVVGKAPEPQLSVRVTQDGDVVESTLDVRPNSLLTMEVSLDRVSAPTYGIAVSSMTASDTGANVQEIIADGCSTQPQLFGGFNSTDGDKLTASFKPFKFPTTSYVLFQGVCDVCINRCEGVRCPNGQVSYGRRRRRSLTLGQQNSVYQVTTSTLINVARVHNLLPQTTNKNVPGEFWQPSAVGYVERVRSFTALDQFSSNELSFNAASSHLATTVFVLSSVVAVLLV